ncbi:hypothetical protein BDV26DRAFT_61898 [Aspergillus bertholletiae]|uniref:Uncharacterized protein n=1 Tax=Aspergillus bertholletiae TaxID=1226010 RepID=A0A5N7AUS4_9EURO|nr:hypothetical protein BDV26DRAFT_61898 [Aspergillus bertholletiae]
MQTRLLSKAQTLVASFVVSFIRPRSSSDPYQNDWSDISPCAQIISQAKQRLNDSQIVDTEVETDRGVRSVGRGAAGARRPYHVDGEMNDRTRGRCVEVAEAFCLF